MHGSSMHEWQGLHAKQSPSPSSPIRSVAKTLTFNILLTIFKLQKIQIYTTLQQDKKMTKQSMINTNDIACVWIYTPGDNEEDVAMWEEASVASSMHSMRSLPETEDLDDLIRSSRGPPVSVIGQERWNSPRELLLRPPWNELVNAMLTT